MKNKKANKKMIPVHKRLHRHIKLALIPHALNQYRPHLVRRHGLVALLVLVIGVHAAYNYSTSGTVLGSQASITASSLLSETNRARAAQQLAPLTLNDKLSQAAFLKGQDMLEQQYWAHVAPNGTTPWQWFSAVGYNYSHAGENLAKNFKSADAVMNAWMDSPKHRANVLGVDYSQVGFAAVDGELEGKPVSLIVAMYASESAPATVAGSKTELSPPLAQTGGVVSQLGIMVQSLTPATVGSIVLMSMGIVVALAAHAYRHRLPRAFKKTWYLHHGAYKAVGLTSLLFVVVALYSGGQI